MSPGVMRSFSSTSSRETASIRSGSSSMRLSVRPEVTTIPSVSIATTSNSTVTVVSRASARKSSTREGENPMRSASMTC